jgi:hypothetical protein
MLPMPTDQPSHGDAMSDPSSKDDDAALAAYRQRSATREAEIKSAILTWLGTRDNPGDYVSVTRALLEIALDRHVATHEANGFDLIEAAYRRALVRQRGPLQ